MLNELSAQIRRYDMLSPGDTVTCAVSGGADSMALLWAMYLLRENLDIRLQAAHFNHHLRGAESDRDAEFVRAFCQQFQIPLSVGSGSVRAGEKGLEAAARDARYQFLTAQPGKIATAHTADDNAETVLMHLVRGTGLRGLGGIAPVSGRLIRPMLTCTRQQVEAFLEEYHISHVDDSSNQSDAFLRNRLRHHVMPLLKAENPRLAENLSHMAMVLREDGQILEAMAAPGALPEVPALRAMSPALRSRMLAGFLEDCGVREPSRAHIALAEALVFSDKPAARADFPGGVTLCRSYDRLTVWKDAPVPEARRLPCPGSAAIPEDNLQVLCTEADALLNTREVFTIRPCGPITVRFRQSGDTIRLNAGTRSLKKLFIDRKIPAHLRDHIPVLADDAGVLGVYGIGANLDRIPPSLPAVQIRFQTIGPIPTR
ncbi:MAG: tRNA lysidine(34) synthetase TilS [Firmicutes bacterium]|nr:tRNA lysidine(34) synthetase TilS [Bacillota bacterium]